MGGRIIERILRRWLGLDKKKPTPKPPVKDPAPPVVPVPPVPPPSTNPPASTPAVPPLPEMDQLLQAHNKIRAANGVRPLRLDLTLGKAAQAHSDDQARHQKMSHIGSDGSSPYQRMTYAGYRYTSAGENVAMGYTTAASVVEGWMDSPGHRENILRGYSEVGFGVASDSKGRRYWTACFATPAGAGLAVEVNDLGPDLFPKALVCEEIQDGDSPPCRAKS